MANHIYKVAEKFLQSKYEEGKPADPTENMSEEDGKKWDDMNDEHKDNFKKTAEDKSWSDGDRSAPRTPWGPAQGATKIAQGVVWYSCAGHGGMVITPVAAKKLEISHAALKMGEHWNGNFWYEEDVAWSVPLLDSPLLLTLYNRKHMHSLVTEQHLQQSVRKYFPRYFQLKEQGYQLPQPPQVGTTFVFNRGDVSFGGTSVPVGTVGKVDEVRKSKVIFHLIPAPGVPSMGLLAMTLSQFHSEMITIQPSVGVKQAKLRKSLIRLAHSNPEIREYVLPMLKNSGGLHDFKPTHIVYFKHKTDGSAFEKEVSVMVENTTSMINGQLVRHQGYGEAPSRGEFMYGKPATWYKPLGGHRWESRNPTKFFIRAQEIR